MLSFTEENYLKALLHLTFEDAHKHEIGTNDLAGYLDVKPATATDMLKKLKQKQLIDYEKYGKITLTDNGKRNAIQILRKHRLWETFLYDKLQFSWDEVHEVAEQLEHIQSQKLVDKLDEFLGFPEFDPHGDAIPSAKGELKTPFKKTLADIAEGKLCKMVAVRDNSAAFLKYITQLGLGINSRIGVLARQEYDGSMELEVESKKISVSSQVAENILVVI